MSFLINPFISYPYDTDAQAFIDAVATLTTPQEIAWNDFVVGCKSDGVWTPLKAIYPLIGGTASAHKWNAKNPLDTDGAFRATFGGTLTHDANGITGGATGYVNTHLSPAISLSSASNSMGVYIRTNVNEQSADIGIYTTSPESYFSIWSRYDGDFYSWQYTSIGSVTAATATSIGLWQTSVTSVTSHKAFLNGVQFGSTDTVDTSSSFSALNYPVFFMAENNQGLGAVEFSTRNISFVYISDGLTDAQILLLRNRIQTLQTALGRNI
jgi:hypothetical protein